MSLSALLEKTGAADDVASAGLPARKPAAATSVSPRSQTPATRGGLAALMAAAGIDPDDDTGQTVPESSATLAAQTQAVEEKRQRAVMFPAGTPEAALPSGLARLETPRGVFHYDPAQITPEEITTASAARRENDVLGLGPASKADVAARAAQGEPVGAVVERTPEGVEVKAAVATPFTAPAALREMQARKAPQNTVRVEPVADVVAARSKPTAKPAGLAALMAAVGEGQTAPPQSTTRNAINQAVRGAVDQGIYQGLEGLARMADQIDRRADAEQAKGPQWRGLAATLGELERAEAQAPNAKRREQIAAVKARMAELDTQAAPAVAVIQSRPLNASAPGWYAGAVADTRGRIRNALPVDDAFARSLGGQIIAGLGQAAGTLPLYAVPGAGPGVSIGQLFTQGREDALAKGADEATADRAGFANVPAAALDVATDKLVIGKILKPLRGKLTVGQLVAAVGVNSAAGGASESAQQGWQNLVARSLVAYDPDRALDDQVINSLIVGVAVAGTTTAAGQAVTQATASRPQSGASSTPATEGDGLTGRADQTQTATPAQRGLTALLAQTERKATPEAEAIGLNALLERVGSEPSGADEAAPRVDSRAETLAESDGKTPVGDRAELVAAQIEARPPEDFRPRESIAETGFTGPDADLVTQLARWGDLSRPDARSASAEPETFEQFAERAEARFGERARPYLTAAYLSGGNGERVAGHFVTEENPLALESTWRRALTYGRLFWEGSADVLRRSGLRSLASAVEQHTDATDRNLAQAWAPVATALAPFRGVRGLARRGELKQALATFETYHAAREDGRAADAARILAEATPEARALVSAVGQAMAYTGAKNRRLGVRVKDHTGKVRPIGELGAEYFPRIVRPEVAEVLRDPSTNPERWREMQDELLAAGLIKDRAEAADYLRAAAPVEDDAARPYVTRGDRFAPLAVARGARLPASWLRHDFGVVGEYVSRWAERAAQIEAFGEKVTPDDLDAFDYSLRAVKDDHLRSYVEKTRAAAYRVNTMPRALRAALGNVTAATTGLLMGNPYSTFRNLVGGVAQTANQAGLWRSAVALRDAWRAAAQADAASAGALKADVADLLFQTEGARIVRDAAGLALKVNGFSAVETFVRSHNYLAARAVLRDSLRALRERPGSRRAAQAVAFLRRHGIDPDKIEAEGGRGPETDRFLRDAVRQSQGSYRYSEVPLFSDSPLGRFVFQFYRWGAMATRFHAKHVLAPAIVGEVVTLRNADGSTSRRRVRTLTPLLRSPLVVMAAGAATFAVREAVFGIARTDQTWDEVFEALSEDEQRGVELALGRMVNDLVMCGSFGMASSWADTLRWAIKTGEPRSPVEPPAVGLAAEIVAFGRKAHAQGGDLSAQDWREFVGRIVTAYKYDTALAHTFADHFGAEWRAAERHRAEQDRRFARAVGRRFAEARGLPPPTPPPEGIAGVSRNAPLFDALEDALHEGDPEAVQVVVGEALAGIRTDALRAKVRARLRNAALRRAPMVPAGRQDAATREDFRAWLRDNLSDADRQRVEDAQRRFILTAVRGGLIRPADLERYAEP